VRGLALLFLLVSAVAAERGESEEELLQRWGEADPEERRRLSVVLDRIERARRFSSARPILVEFRDRTYTLAELFSSVLEPALATAPRPESEGDPGLLDIHVRALEALKALRGAYAPPHPVRTGTLNLLLGYAWRALAAQPLSPALRLRFFTEAIRNVQRLDGRVAPDARTGWLIHNRLLPALLGLARRVHEDAAARETVAEAAALLYLPSILDETAQAQLAPLTSGTRSREVLVRFYRDDLLDDLGRVALARSVAMQASDDAAFAAGAPPLLLELLCDAQLPEQDRGLLLDVVSSRLAGIELLQSTAYDLLAAGFGGPPREPEAYRAERRHRPDGIPLPRGTRVFRFLSVVLWQGQRDAPPGVARVVRADLAHYQPLYARDARGARRFVGVLVPDGEGRHADFLGPPPGVTGRRDNRLLRRRLDLERIAIHTFGARGEEMELCVTLPEDESEPVPVRGGNLGHVLALLDARLRRAPDPAERRELVRLLVRIDTGPASDLAVRHAAAPGTVAELLPLAERGHAAATRGLLARIADLGPEERVRALGAALTARPPQLDAVRALCRHGDVAVAVPAGDALLAAADASGAAALLEHPNKYARLAGVALTLRLTPLAGSLRVVPGEHADLERIAQRAGRAFGKRDGEPWVKLGQWLGSALRRPAEARRLRREHKRLFLGERSVLAYEFAAAWTRGIRDGKARDLWPALVSFLLDPHDPGRGILERDLNPLLDALEARAREDEKLRRVWIDGLVVLAGVQYGMEADVSLAELAQERLARIAGTTAPPQARRKGGIYWPIWAAQKEQK
jgi:hypothetical protein